VVDGGEAIAKTKVENGKAKSEKRKEKNEEGG